MGWTMDYLEHQIPYAVAIRCLVDLPRYESESEANQTIKLTADNAADFVKLINKK
jgi:nucleoside phosphorylase